jgi:endoglucanase
MGKDYQIDPRLMARVEEVVGYVLDEGMVAVVNIHWDGGWWSKFPTEFDESMKRYKTMWSQIAGRFKDHPGTLIFESLNEEGCFNDVWNRYGGANPQQKQRAYGILNEINQAFVDLVRASGGRTTSATSSSRLRDRYRPHRGPLVRDAQGPGPTPHRLGALLHPLHVRGPREGRVVGQDARGWGTESDLAELTNNMLKVKTTFVDKGVRSSWGVWRHPQEQGPRERAPLPALGGRDCL